MNFIPPVISLPSLNSTVNKQQFSLPYEDVNNNIKYLSPSRGSPNWAFKKSKRRKSSSSRYGFDDSFIKLVTIQCGLQLDPDDVLGRGSFGTVISGTYQGNPIAAKILTTKTESQIQSVKNEQQALELPPFPYIVKLFEFFQIGPERAIIVLEKLRKGNLLTVLNNSSKFELDFNTTLKIAIEITLAVQFCHSHSLLHLDIKPQNVLIDFNNCCKLTDFGNCWKIDEFERSYSRLINGTVAYKAPELFYDCCPTPKCDVYSLGVTFWHLMTREIPYFGENEHSVIYKVVAQAYRPKEPTTDLMTSYSQFIQLYKKCWREHDVQRPEVCEIINELYALQILTNNDHK